MIQDIEKVSFALGRMLPPKKAPAAKTLPAAPQVSQPSLKPLEQKFSQMLPPTPQQIMASKPLGGAPR